MAVVAGKFLVRNPFRQGDIPVRAFACIYAEPVTWAPLGSANEATGNGMAALAREGDSGRLYLRLAGGSGNVEIEQIDRRASTRVNSAAVGKGDFSFVAAAVKRDFQRN